METAGQKQRFPRHLDKPGAKKLWRERRKPFVTKQSLTHSSLSITIASESERGNCKLKHIVFSPLCPNFEHREYLTTSTSLCYISLFLVGQPPGNTQGNIVGGLIADRSCLPCVWFSLSLTNRGDDGEKWVLTVSWKSVCKLSTPSTIIVASANKKQPILSAWSTEWEGLATH